MILSIETSCDETAAALVEREEGGVRVVSSVVSSQIALHAPFGGVVPALAAREHAKNIVPVIETALREANISANHIEAIAVTGGPGLSPALRIGIMAGKTLSYLMEKPLLPIHHIEGHIYANTILPSQASPHSSEFHFPLLALVVSGGHTELVLVRTHFAYEILGATEDDAAGEAFDKVAKMLGLPYPGGPEIARRAEIFRALPEKERSPAPEFPRPMIDSGDFRFSFSGLKTAVLYFLKKNVANKESDHFIEAVSFAFEEAVLETLLAKTRLALETFQPATLTVVGGVSANTELRRRMRALTQTQFPRTHFMIPELRYSLDNAAMIGAAALFHFERMSDTHKDRARALWKTLGADPNLPLGAYEECLATS